MTGLLLKTQNNMKIKDNHWRWSVGLFSIFIGLVLTSCSPDTVEDLRSEPLTAKPEVLQGTWKLSKVMQIDQVAVDNAFPEAVQSLDITDLFDFGSFELRFDIDDSATPSTFSTSRSENLPVFIVNSGQWSVDNQIFTTKIDLADPSAITGTQLVVRSITSDRLEVRVLRVEEGSEPPTVFSRYDYTFVKL